MTQCCQANQRSLKQLHWRRLTKKISQRPRSVTLRGSSSHLRRRGYELSRPDVRLLYNLHVPYKRRYVCLSVRLSVCGRWPAERLGRSRPNLAWGLMLTQGVFQARSRSRSCGANWRMLIKLLTEARKGRQNSSAKRDKYGGQRPAGPRQ